MTLFPGIVKKTLDEKRVSSQLAETFLYLYETYAASLKEDGIEMDQHEHLFETFFARSSEQYLHPYQFELYHAKITQPFNYYAFGIDFLRPLIDEKRSLTLYPENLDKMTAQLNAGENVILFANHQTEVDPQLMSHALEKNYPEIAEEVIFVAGHRVSTDPMAIPFSMGRNLLCIYSKRHIDNPPEKRAEKQHHNQRTMRRMRELLAEGGKCIYVAPSGGRDRPSQNGEVAVDPFDPQSIEMFRLIAKQSKKPCHFYPMALATFDILPPPDTVQKDLGEKRKAHRDGTRFAFPDEIDMDNFPGCDMQDRHAKRSARAMYIWNLVKHAYQELKT